MYNNTRSKVRVDDTYSDEFGVKVLKLELIRVQYVALSYSSLCLKLCRVSSKPGHPGSCYADDLVIIAETEDELEMKLIKWKANLEPKT